MVVRRIRRSCWIGQYDTIGSGRHELGWRGEYEDYDTYGMAKSDSFGGILFTHLLYFMSVCYRVGN